MINVSPSSILSYFTFSFERLYKDCQVGLIFQSIGGLSHKTPVHNCKCAGILCSLCLQEYNAMVMMMMMIVIIIMIIIIEIIAFL